MSQTSKRNNTRLTPIDSLQEREIYFIDFGVKAIWCRFCGKSNRPMLKCVHCGRTTQIDSTTKGSRPIIIVYVPLLGDKTKEEAMVVAIPVTSHTHNNEPGTVIIPADSQTGLSSPSQALVYQVTAVDKVNFFKEYRMGRVGDNEWVEIKDKLKNLLGVESNIIQMPDGRFVRSTDVQALIEENKMQKKMIQDNHSLKKLNDGLAHKISSQEASYKKNKQEFETKKRECDKAVEQLKRLLEQCNNDLKNAREADSKSLSSS